jgi:hypothetical protein
MPGGSQLGQFAEALILYKPLNGVTKRAVLLTDGIRHAYPRLEFLHPGYYGPA